MRLSSWVAGTRGPLIARLNHLYMWDTWVGAVSITTTKHYPMTHMKGSSRALTGRTRSQYPTVRLSPLCNCNLHCHAYDLWLDTVLVVSQGEPWMGWSSNWWTQSLNGDSIIAWTWQHSSLQWLWAGFGEHQTGQGSITQWYSCKQGNNIEHTELSLGSHWNIWKLCLKVDHLWLYCSTK